MPDKLFDSLNPCDGWEILVDRTPVGLMKQIKAIRTPIAVKFMFPHGNRVYAVISGDVRIVKKKRTK